MKKEIIAVIFIIIGIVLFNSYSRELVTGLLEVKWAYEGFQFTNKDIGLIMYFGTAALGTYLLINKYAKNNKNAAIIIGITLVSIMMSLSEVLQYLVSLCALVYILILTVKSKILKGIK